MNIKPAYERFDSPEALASDLAVPAAQRRQQLVEWSEDLNAKLRASDESMTSKDPGRAGALLPRVLACLAMMDQAQTHGA